MSEKSQLTGIESIISIQTYCLRENSEDIRDT